MGLSRSLATSVVPPDVGPYGPIRTASHEEREQADYQECPLATPLQQRYQDDRLMHARTSSAERSPGPRAGASLFAPRVRFDVRTAGRPRSPARPCYLISWIPTASPFSTVQSLRAQTGPVVMKWMNQPAMQLLLPLPLIV
jgi:hypothetical protein